MVSAKNLEQSLNDAGLEQDDQNRVQWQKHASQHPRSWNHSTKIYNVLVVTWLESFMTAISASGAATAEGAMSEYGISSTLAYFVFLSMYLLGQTIGAIFCSPISEVLGRRSIYIVASILFCISSIIVAAPPNLIAVYFGRFFQGAAAAIPATVAFGNFEDVYDANHRIWVVYAYTFWGISGLAIGPIYSAYITHYCGWRWVYWISAIASAISAIACCFIKESNAEQLLESAVKRISRDNEGAKLRPATPHDHMTLSSFAKNNLILPIRLLMTEPIVFFCAALCAIAFSLVYGLTEALTIVYTLPPFDSTFDMINSSLSFIAFLIGQMFNVLPRIYDFQLLCKYRKQKKRILPETKITSLLTSCPALAIGLWIFAWTVPPMVQGVPWIVSMVGLVGIGYATNDLSYILFGYVTDSYGAKAASAVSAVSLTRTLAAAALPLFTTQMYEGLGANQATTIFAAIATGFCITPWLFLTYGAKLRKHSRFCAQGDKVLAKENEHMNDEQGEGNDSSMERKKDLKANAPTTNTISSMDIIYGDIGSEYYSGSGTLRFSSVGTLADSWTQT